jgi:glycosyltransferase involved in cell wall biosynthesis
MSKISVIMNCYNGSKYLKEALESIINQTYKDWELIFWDNQSTDTSAEIFLQFEDSRFNYFYAEQHTLLYEARSYAEKKTSGDFLTFLDVDDVWSIDKLQKQIELFGDKKVGLVYGNYSVIGENTKKLNPINKKKLPSGYVLNELLEDYSVGLLTIMIRREAFESLAKKFDKRFHIIGDFDLVLRLSINWKFKCIQEVIAFYRQHNNNESLKNRDKFISESLIWYSEMKFHPDFSAKEIIHKRFYLYLYHDAILDKLQGGSIIRVISVFNLLPMSTLKFKLFIVILFPNFLYHVIKKINMLSLRNEQSIN